MRVIYQHTGLLIVRHEGKEHAGLGHVVLVAETSRVTTFDASVDEEIEGQAQWHGELDVQLGPEVGEEIEVDTGVRRGRAWVERSTFGRIEFRGSGDLEKYRPTR